MDRAKDWNDFREAAARLRRSPRRTSSTPTPRATSATRRRAGSPSAPRATTAAARRPAGTPRTGGRRATSAVDALPYEYNPDARLHRHRQPGRHRPEASTRTLLTTDWGYGTRSQRITDLIESKIKDGGKISTDDMRQMQLDNSSEIAKLLVPVPAEDRRQGPRRPRGAEAAGGLGLHPGRRLGGRRLLQRGLAQHPQAGLRRQAAQGAAGQGPVPAGPPGRQHRSASTT